MRRSPPPYEFRIRGCAFIARAPRFADSGYFFFFLNFKRNEKKIPIVDDTVAVASVEILLNPGKSTVFVQTVFAPESRAAASNENCRHRSVDVSSGKKKPFRERTRAKVRSSLRNRGAAHNVGTLLLRFGGQVLSELKRFLRGP